MTSNRFLLKLAGIICAVTVPLVAINIKVDLYGLFRSGHGPTLKVYGEERNCKYLFSYRYIPENFQSLLLGSSVSDNIPVRTIAGFRTYNASLNGGDITEAKILGLNAMRHGHFKLVVLSLHRYLVRDAGAKTNFMVPLRYWGALGSTQLYAASLGLLLDHEGFRPGGFDEYGAQHYGASAAGIRDDVENFAARLRRGERAGWLFDIHPQALADLQELIQAVHNRGIQFAAFYPPMPSALIDANEQQLADFKRSIRRAFGAQDIFVDFTASEYRRYNDDYGNFHDGAHMSDAGAQTVAAELDQAITAALPDRQGGRTAPVPGGH